MEAALRQALERHRVSVSQCPTQSALARAIQDKPDLVLLLGDAIPGHGVVLANLARHPKIGKIPVALLMDAPDLEHRLAAIRAGAAAVIRREASADAAAIRLRELVDSMQGMNQDSAELGETTLDELVQLVSHKLRAGIVSVEGDDGTPVRMVLGAGGPLAEALDQFVGRLRPLVAEAEPLRYEMLSSSPDRLGLFGRDEAAGDLEILCDLRILVMDNDATRADGLAQSLRERGALVAVGDAGEDGLDRARQLDPSVIVLDAKAIEGQGFEAVRQLRKDRRLRWASLLVARWDELWPPDAPVPNLARLAARIAPLVEQDRLAKERARNEESFDTRLEQTGPGRLLRALSEVEGTRRIDVRHEQTLVEVDVGDDLIIGCRAHLEHGLSVEGVPALARLLMLGSGRVHVERRAHPATANVMSPAEEALAAANFERISLLADPTEPGSGPTRFPSAAALLGGDDPLGPLADDESSRPRMEPARQTKIETGHSSRQPPSKRQLRWDPTPAHGVPLDRPAPGEPRYGGEKPAKGASTIGQRRPSSKSPTVQAGRPPSDASPSPETQQGMRPLASASGGRRPPSAPGQRPTPQHRPSSGGAPRPPQAPPPAPGPASRQITAAAARPAQSPPPPPSSRQVTAASERPASTPQARPASGATKSKTLFGMAPAAPLPDTPTRQAGELYSQSEATEPRIEGPTKELDLQRRTVDKHSEKTRQVSIAEAAAAAEADLDNLEMLSEPPPEGRATEDLIIPDEVLAGAASVDETKPDVSPSLVPELPLPPPDFPPEVQETARFDRAELDLHRAQSREDQKPAKGVNPLGSTMLSMDATAVPRSAEADFPEMDTLAGVGDTLGAGPHDTVTDDRALSDAVAAHAADEPQPPPNTVRISSHPPPSGGSVDLDSLPPLPDIVGEDSSDDFLLQAESPNVEVSPEAAVREPFPGTDDPTFKIKNPIPGVDEEGVPERRIPWKPIIGVLSLLVVAGSGALAYKVMNRGPGPVATAPEADDPIGSDTTPVEPSEPEPTDPEPTDVEPTEAEPTDVEPTNVEPTDVEPTEAEPTEAEPTDVEPTDVEPTEPEPTEPEPTESTSAMGGVSLPSETELARMSDRERDRRSDALVREANRALAAGGNGPQVEATLEAALAYDERNPRAMAALAVYHLARNEGAQALQWAQQAVRRRGRRGAYRVLLGDALRMTGDDAGAREAYQRALDLDPDDRTARRRLGE